MCLLDTTDGALMMTLYTSTSLARDQIAILYYSIVLTSITIAAAMAIGVIQLLSLILNAAEPTGRFWDGVENVSDHYDILGGAICGSFVVAGVLSVLFYGTFRRAVDRRMGERGTLGVVRESDASNEGEGEVEIGAEGEVHTSAGDVKTPAVTVSSSAGPSLQ